MTALFMDCFDFYGTGGTGITNMLAGPWASSQQLTIAAPPWGASRTGSFCLRNTGFGPSGAAKALPTPGAVFYTSFGFAVDQIVPGNPRLIEWQDGSATTLFYLVSTATGALQVWSGAGALLGTTAGPVIVGENWHFIEVAANTSTNTVTVRVDDPTAGNTPILTVTNAAITGTVALIAFLTATGGGIAQVDDVFIRDGAGSVNNGFLGDRRIGLLLADADFTPMGWTPRFYQQLGAGILNDTAANACVSAASATSLNVGAGDFTIETFIRWQALPSGSNKAVIFSKWDETANTRSYQLFLGSAALNGGSLCFQTSTDGTNTTVLQPIVYPFTPELDAWYHVALVRASSELLLFVNGQQLGLPIADSRTYFAGAAPMGLGGQMEAGGAIANTETQGWFDETRFTVGFARYTSNFTPTTVEFPRNVSGDPQFADVALLCGFDSLIQDESSFARALTARNGAVQQLVLDGISVGDWSTLGKAQPDDNTFMEAPLLSATGILTLTLNPTNATTVTIHGAVSQAYTFKTVLASAFDVLIDTNIQNSLQNLYNAINAGPGSGTKYGAGTTANVDVTASQLPAGQMMVTANTAGTGGNATTTTTTVTGGSWGSGTLTGGTSIPGSSNFKVQRPPPFTTIISAIQIMPRAFKSDAGLGSMNTALVGGLGGATAGPTHSLTVSPSYYPDIFELDPDTSAAITPSTLINGAIRINRDT